MVNHLFNRFFNRISNNLVRITLPSALLSSPGHSRALCTEFKDVYSKENLMRCLADLNGLDYRRSTDEEKRKFFEIKNAKDPKRAGVLIPFCYNEQQEPSIILTLRSPNLATHKNEVCFPGGVYEEQDEGDICRTAARETQEELGIDLSAIEVLGVLRPLAGKQSNSFVFPVIAVVDLTKEGKHNIEFHNKNLDEVQEVFVRPLSELVKPKHWCMTHWATGITTPLYRDEIFNDKSTPRIWGLSGYFLFLVLSSLVPAQFNLQYTTLKRYREKPKGKNIFQ